MSNQMQRARGWKTRIFVEIFRLIYVTFFCTSRCSSSYFQIWNSQKQNTESNTAVAAVHTKQWLITLGY